MAGEDSLRWWGRHERHQFRDKKDPVRFSERQIRQYLDHLLARRPGSEHAIIKQPELTQHFPTLDHVFKNARFVVMARDPRDIAVSIMAIGRKLGEKGVDNPHPRDMEVLGRRVTRSYAILYRAKRSIWGGRLAWVQYERLVSDPISIAGKLAAFTGLDLSGYDPWAAWSGSDDGRIASEKLEGTYDSDLWGKAVTNERVEGWRQALTEEKTQTVLRMCPYITEMFGYGKENDVTGRQP